MSGRLVVLESFKEPSSTTNPYIVMLARSLAAQPGVELRTFTWRAALLGRFDVFHVHWPEVLLRGPSRLKTARRRLLFALLLIRLAVAHKPVIRTRHNLAPHDGVGRTESVLMGLLDRLTTSWIEINDTGSEEPGPRPTWVVRHGHYRDWFAPYPKPPAVPGRLSLFGLLKPYKGVDTLIAAFRGAAAADPDLSLRVAGRTASEAFGAELRELAAGQDRIELALEYIDDAELVRLIGESELVVFPYRSMYNSGGVLAALSLARPVLVPENAVNSCLADEVGPGWVNTYRGELTAGDLARALASVRDERPAGEPDLTGREWAAAGPAHVEIFRSSLAGRRARLRLPRAVRRAS